MNNAKRFLAALLCALMVVPTIAGCSDGGEGTTGDTPAAADTTAAEDTTPVETDRSQAKDNLPEGLNFGISTSTRPANRICTEHLTQAPIVPEPPINPEDPTVPGEPAGPPAPEQP